MAPTTFSASIPLSGRSEEHTSELQSLRHLVCRLLLEKKKNTNNNNVDIDNDGIKSPIQGSNDPNPAENAHNTTTHANTKSNTEHLEETIHAGTHADSA